MWYNPTNEGEKQTCCPRMCSKKPGFQWDPLPQNNRIIWQVCWATGQEPGEWWMSTSQNQPVIQPNMMNLSKGWYILKGHERTCDIIYFPVWNSPKLWGLGLPVGMVLTASVGVPSYYSCPQCEMHASWSLVLVELISHMFGDFWEHQAWVSLDFPSKSKDGPVYLATISTPKWQSWHLFNFFALWLSPCSASSSAGKNSARQLSRVISPCDSSGIGQMHSKLQKPGRITRINTVMMVTALNGGFLSHGVAPVIIHF